MTKLCRFNQDKLYILSIPCIVFTSSLLAALKRVGLFVMRWVRELGDEQTYCGRSKRPPLAVEAYDDWWVESHLADHLGRAATRTHQRGDGTLQQALNWPYCLRQKCSPINLFFSNIWFMVIYLDITEKECVKNRYLALDSENSTRATLRIFSHHSCSEISTLAENKRTH